MDIGFTGTEEGMTDLQKDRVQFLLEALEPERVHHGMCIGADKEFNDMCLDLGIYIVGHPGVTSKGKRWKRADCLLHEERPVKQFLDRNTDIVEESDLLIATPKEMVEELRSGTWSTIRRARKAEIQYIIIYPDGTTDD